MALFGDKKKEVKGKKAVARKIYHTRTSKLSGGVAHDILRAPWFSEKSLIMTEKEVYTFAVSPRSTKSAIAAAIKEIYNVEPRAIRIVNLPAKRKMMRTKRGIGTRAARCKAYVYLNAGDTIQFS